MKNLIFILIACIQMTAFGQNKYISFKDGSQLERTVFIDKCINSIVTETPFAFKDKGLSFCNCILDDLALEFTYNEYLSAFSYSNKSGATLEEKQYKVLTNPTIERITDNCLRKFINQGSNDISDFYISQCKSDMKSSLSDTDYYEFLKIIDIDKYCKCYSYQSINQLSFSESNEPNKNTLDKMQQIQDECLSKSYN